MLRESTANTTSVPEIRRKRKPESANVALDWIERGYLPIPIPFLSKRPIIEEWQHLRIGKADVPRYFNGQPQNIGVLLGEPYGAADMDLDCPEAIAAAAVLAPATGLIFGRASSPGSHRFYRSDPPMPAKKYLDPTDKACLCELRCLKADGTVGLQTVVPGSVHEQGEPIRFEPGFDREPANIDGDVLQRAVARIAAAAVLARHWPAAGHGRHECELALAGTLARAGWSLEDAEQFVLATYRAVPDHDRGALGRVRESVRSTFAKMGNDTPTTGFTKLCAAVGAPVAKAATSWLDIKPDQGRAVAAQGAPVADWRDQLITNRDGNPKPILANAITALRLSPEWAGTVAYNEFAATLTIQKVLPWGGNAGGTWSDQHDRKFAEWLQRNGILAPTKLAGEAVQTVAMERPYHPCREYLRGLAWDSVGRVDLWLTTYLGVQPSTYASKIGRRWLVSAVARILQPGVKADAVLVLEGAQGIGKSTAGRILFDPWFCDHLPDLSSKDSYLQLAGMWCIELAELDAIGRADASRIKSFLSSSVDRYRLPYGTRAIDVPRASVFLGTVNHGAYLRDETGNRRFWPVRCGRIDTDALRRDRDQLWAEAVELHANGASWWVDSADLARLAEEEQAARFEGEAWDSEIAEWARLRENISVAEVLGDCLKKDRAMWSQSDSNRVARSLRSMGWERYRERSTNGLQWRYRRQGL